VGAAIGLGHEQRDILSDHLLGAVTEQAFRRRVESVNDAARVDGDDGIHCRIDDRAHARLALTQRRFGLLAPRDIVHRGKHVPPRIRSQRTQAHVHRKFAAILAPCMQIQTGTHRPFARERGESSALCKMFFAQALRDQPFDGQHGEFIAAVTEQALSGGIGISNVAVWIDDQDGVAGALQHPAEALVGKRGGDHKGRTQQSDSPPEKTTCSSDRTGTAPVWLRF